MRFFLSWTISVHNRSLHRRITSNYYSCCITTIEKIIISNGVSSNNLFSCAKKLCFSASIFEKKGTLKRNIGWTRGKIGDHTSFTLRAACLSLLWRLCRCTGMSARRLLPHRSYGKLHGMNDIPGWDVPDQKFVPCLYVMECNWQKFIQGPYNIQTAHSLAFPILKLWNLLPSAEKPHMCVGVYFSKHSSSVRCSQVAFWRPGTTLY